MSPIIPAVIPKTFDELEMQCRKILPITHEIQIDIVDGHFVPFTSWPYGEEDSVADLKRLSDIFLFEMDLMIQHPEDTVEEYLKAGARRIIIHLESTDKLPEIHQLKLRYDFKLGISLNNDTPLEQLYELINFADYIQVMGIKEIGSQGQPFDIRVLERIRELKKRFPELLVSIDGSVNLETLGPIVEAGIDRCAVGSALLKSYDMMDTYKEMQNIFTSIDSET
jgi:ribulose-phosphate 3-epimerase